MPVDTDALVQSAFDEQEADLNVLSENKARDIVEIANGNVIANEHQMYISHLGLTTGFMFSMGRQVNTINFGPSAAGKSDVQDATTNALPLDVGYQATDSSAMGVVDDSRWEESLFAPLDEWQKIPEKLTEIIKSVSGGPDDEYRYVRSVSDDDEDSGRTGHEIVKKAMPYSFLYAQHALDHELSTRLVFLPVDDNIHIREAIVRKQAGHENIDVEGYDKEFIYDVSDLETAVRQHFRDLPTVTEDLDSGEENVRGGVDARLPPWVHYAVEPIFNMSSIETNRVSGQVYNLIRAATIHNYDNRTSITEEMDGFDIEVYVTEPQDVANVLSTRETLLATTHRLTKRKRKILEAVRANTGVGDEGSRGITIETVRNYLKNSTMQSVPRKQKLRDLLNELAEQFYIRIDERAGPNGAHLYEFISMRDIGVPRVSNLTAHMDDEQIKESTTLNPDIDLDDPFADCHDPFTDEPFKDSVEAMRKKFASDPVERATETADLVSENQGDDSGSEGGSMSLSDAMGGGDTDETDAPDPSEKLDGPVENAVYEHLKDHADGEIFLDDAEEAHLVGAVDEGERVVDAEVSGTILDPDHDLWDQSDQPDDWVVSRKQAAREIEQAVDRLEREGLIGFEQSRGGFKAKVL